MPQTTPFAAHAAVLDEIVRFRDLYRQEMDAQIVHDSYHARGFCTPYRLERAGTTVGYGAVGEYDTRGKEVVVEFYVTPAHRGDALPLFHALLSASGATRVRAQTNDRLLCLTLYDLCRPESIASDTILFEDAGDANLPAPPGARARPVRDDEKAGIFEHRSEPVGDTGVEVDGRIVGTGGFLCHYNPPYGDVFMEVDAAYRGRGIGAFLVQEVKRAAYAAGRRPSARCNADNTASRRTLQRAGFVVCGRILYGAIAG